MEWKWKHSVELLWCGAGFLVAPQLWAHESTAFGLQATTVMDGGWFASLSFQPPLIAIKS